MLLATPILLLRDITVNKLTQLLHNSCTHHVSWYLLYCCMWALPRNGCFSSSTVLALSKYVTVLLIISRHTYCHNDIMLTYDLSKMMGEIISFFYPSSLLYLYLLPHLPSILLPDPLSIPSNSFVPLFHLFLNLLPSFSHVHSNPLYLPILSSFHSCILDTTTNIRLDFPVL
jgi:hypothetical protein